jgi:hypothetical protein
MSRIRREDVKFRAVGNILAHKSHLYKTQAVWLIYQVFDMDNGPQLHRKLKRENQVFASLL